MSMRLSSASPLHALSSWVPGVLEVEKGTLLKAHYYLHTLSYASTKSLPTINLRTLPNLYLHQPRQRTFLPSHLLSWHPIYHSYKHSLSFHPSSMLHSTLPLQLLALLLRLLSSPLPTVYLFSMLQPESSLLYENPELALSLRKHRLKTAMGLARSSAYSAGLVPAY